MTDLTKGADMGKSEGEDIFALEACPFCGWPAEIEPNPLNPLGLSWRIKCTNPKTNGPSPNHCHLHFGGWYSRKFEAREVWNQRRTVPAAALDELVKALELIHERGDWNGLQCRMYARQALEFYRRDCAHAREIAKGGK